MPKGNDIAIKVSRVKKDFRLPHEKSNSLKSSIVHLFSRDKGYSTQHALRDISFEVGRGEFFGIVGRNGSGKSTLLKILAETYQPTSGTVKHYGKIVPFIELGVGFNPELTGRENVYMNGALLGLSRKQIDAKYDEIVQFAELEEFMDQKLKNYSSGMQVRLAFSVATRGNDADILLIDEVLAVGDADFQRKCYDYFKGLKKTDTTIVFVTHDMNAVQTFCDRAILIDNGMISVEGDVRTVADRYLQLFDSSASQEITRSRRTRFGAGDIKIGSAKVETNRNEIKLIFDLESQGHDIDEFVLGYNFRNSDGTIIMGGNTLNAVSGSRKLSMKKNARMRITFTTPNFLGTGEYPLEVTVRDTGNLVFDKWEDVTRLKVTRAESHYPTIAHAKMVVEEVE